MTTEFTPYPIGTPGVPWTEYNRRQWRNAQHVHRSYASDVVAAIDTLRARAAERAGTQLTQTWRATHDGDNQAGDLMAGAATLRFSVGYLRDYGD